MEINFVSSGSRNMGYKVKKQEIYIFVNYFCKSRVLDHLLFTDPVMIEQMTPIGEFVIDQEII